MHNKKKNNPRFMYYLKDYRSIRAFGGSTFKRSKIVLWQRRSWSIFAWIRFSVTEHDTLRKSTSTNNINYLAEFLYFSRNKVSRDKIINVHTIVLFSLEIWPWYLSLAQDVLKGNLVKLCRLSLITTIFENTRFWLKNSPYFNP